MFSLTAQVLPPINRREILAMKSNWWQNQGGEKILFR
jgi:hypothetical protein